jgi:hypothetical protein
MDIETQVRKEWVRGLVQKAIFCPFGGEVLDVRTCVVVLDADNDPRMVISPQTYRRLLAVADENGVEPLGAAYHFDVETIPA